MKCYHKLKKTFLYAEKYNLNRFDLRSIKNRGDFIKEEQGGSEIETGIIGYSFPEIESKSLAGRVVTLPEAVKEKVALICIAFMRNAQDMLDSWIQPFEQTFGNDERFVVYEVPMINKSVTLKQQEF